MSSDVSQHLVQYIVVRGDLQWPVGALIGNACHASVAAIVRHMSSGDKHTIEYIQHLESMTKVVLKADNEEVLRDVCHKLSQNSIAYHLWTEQPEGIITCVATTPRPRDVLKPLLNHLKLFK
ncbi:unnamed protein product [Medioppia subpectinata]|uniref:peptidyl-tRNA hydrolase n=1 Tax=Medioppia subpectinata TaxID=1979941 RepID=A0A7R9L6H3_9ACAR|nr:unnamed protein product [Medioppia subpectinata]CAG2115323.1 unnamed protein product [Medioppia subpectinata]